MFEFNYVYVNTIVISMITIVLESIFGFNGRYRLINKLKSDKSTGSKFSASIQSSIQQTEHHSAISNVYHLRAAIKHVLAYICFILIMLLHAFLIYYFRSIIKLYTFVYAFLIVFVTFVYQQQILNILFAYATNLFRSLSLIDNKTEQITWIRRAASILIYSINFIISLNLAFNWYANRTNGCIWLYHNFLGILICAFCVSVLRLINFQQIFIAFSAFTILDLFFVHFSRHFLDGVNLMHSIAKEQRLFKRQDKGLNIIEELDVARNVINVSMINHLNNLNYSEDVNFRDKLDQITIYRIPSTFFIPKNNLIDAIHGCVDLKNVTIIGFGDLLIPAIIAAYTLYFDRIKNTNFVYFLTSISSSLISLISMMLIDDIFRTNGQPVLVFIVPINFIFLISLSLFRREFNEFWFQKDKLLYATVNQAFAEEVV